ncbi:helix-turn-helix transcriptional regulator [Proteiniphilum sp.]|uniref:helix-turn-helix domain-containing protein n=1 Tax=Proteiniphilum sp. TaxID=1926877 RepID=UPI0033286CA7
MNIKTFDQVKDEVIGLRGTERRDALERELEALRLGIQIRNAREKQNLTQEQLAERINKKRTFISRIENDGSNLTVKTLLDIVEKGLGGKLVISVDV